MRRRTQQQPRFTGNNRLAQRLRLLLLLLPVLLSHRRAALAVVGASFVDVGLEADPSSHELQKGLEDGRSGSGEGGGGGGDGDEETSGRTVGRRHDVLRPAVGSGPQTLQGNFLDEDAATAAAATKTAASVAAKARAPVVEVDRGGRRRRRILDQQPQQEPPPIVDGPVNLTVIYGGGDNGDDDEYSDSSSESTCDGMLGAAATTLDGRYECRCDDCRSSDNSGPAASSAAVVCRSRSPVVVGNATGGLGMVNVTLNLTVFLGSAASSSLEPSSSFRTCFHLTPSFLASTSSTSLATGAYDGGGDDDEPTGTWRSSKEGCLDADFDDSHAVTNCSGMRIDASNGALVRCSPCRACPVEDKGESLDGGGTIEPPVFSFELDCRNVADGGEWWEGTVPESGCRSSWDESGLIPILLPDAASFEASAAAAAAAATVSASSAATISSSLHNRIAHMAVAAVLQLLVAGLLV